MLQVKDFTGVWLLQVLYCQGGTRIEVGSTGSLERIIKGPALLDDGTHNLLGAIRTSMSTLGAKNIKEMQEVEIVIAPSLLTEGKVYQKAQQLGMGK